MYVLDENDSLDAYPGGEFTGKWLLTAELYVTGGGESRLRSSKIKTCSSATYALMESVKSWNGGTRRVEKANMKEGTGQC